MRRRIRWTVIALVLIGVWIAATDAVRAEPQCTCRYAGHSYSLETCVCLVTPGGPRMACCDQVLNNSSWTFTGDACPVASAPADDRAHATAALFPPLRPLSRF